MMQNNGDECDVMVTAEGVRLLELSCLREALEPLLACRFCTVGRLELKEDLNKADKLYSALYLVCGMCPHRLQIHTSRPLPEETHSCRWEVNHCTEQLQANLGINEEVLRNIFKGYRVPYQEPVCHNQKTEGRVQGEFEEEERRNDSVADEDAAADTEEEEELLNTPDTPDTLVKDGSSLSKVSSRSKCYTCLICHQEFLQLAVLKQHSSEHNEQDTFSCPECMETFQTEDSFKTHMKMHGKSNLQCTICGKTFKKTFNLTQHVRTHTGEYYYLPESHRVHLDQLVLPLGLSDLGQSLQEIHCINFYISIIR